jgi:hypothetical protein
VYEIEPYNLYSDKSSWKQSSSLPSKFLLAFPTWCEFDNEGSSRSAAVAKFTSQEFALARLPSLQVTFLPHHNNLLPSSFSTPLQSITTSTPSPFYHQIHLPTHLSCLLQIFYNTLCLWTHSDTSFILEPTSLATWSRLVTSWGQPELPSIATPSTSHLLGVQSINWKLAFIAGLLRKVSYGWHVYFRRIFLTLMVMQLHFPLDISGKRRSANTTL